MPIVRDREALIGRQQLPEGLPGGLPGDPLEEAFPLRRPDFWSETVPAAFREGNTVASEIAAEWRPTTSPYSLQPEVDPDYDLAARLEGHRFAEFAAAFAYVNSDEDFAKVEAKIERELADREILDEAGGWGLLASIAAGVFDPVNLLPVAGTTYKAGKLGYSMLRSAGAVGLSGAGAATAAEAVLHSGQATRTGLESAVNIAGATVLSGALGGLVPPVKRLLGRDPAELAARIERDFTVPAEGAPDPYVPGSVPFEKVVREPVAAPAAAPPRAAAAAAEAGPEINVVIPPRGAGLHPDRPLEAVEFLAFRGGIRDDEGHLLRAARNGQRVRKPFGKLIRNDGRSLDEAGEMLWEGGYFGPPDAVARPTVPEVLNLLERSWAGERVFPYSEAFAVEARRAGREAEEETLRFRDARAAIDELVAARADSLERIEALEDELDEAAGLTLTANLEPEDALAEVMERNALRWLEENESADIGRAAGDDPAPEGLGDGFDDAAGIGRGGPAPGEEPAGAGVAADGQGGDAAGEPATGPGSGGSVGAASALGDARKERLKSALGVERGLKFQDPLLRGVTSPSAETIRTMQRLAETPLAFEKNAEGIATAEGGAVETRIKMWNAPLSEALLDLDDAFLRYRTGRGRGFGRRAAVGARDLAGGAGREGKLTYQGFKKEVARALRQGDRHAIPEVAEAAQSLRAKVFDPLKEAAQREGLLPEELEVVGAESYLMRLYDPQRIAARREDFVGILTRWLQRKNPESDELELRDAAQQITDRILGTPDGRLPYDALDGIVIADRSSGEGSARPLKTRVLDVPDHEIAEFLENDVEVLARIYSRTMAADVEITRAFGDVSMTEQLKRVAEDFNRMIRGAGSELESRKLQRRKDSDIRDLAAVRDRLRNTYALPRDPNSIMVRAGRVVRSLNYMRLLGGMTISALPDIARPIMVQGLTRSFADGLVPLVANFRQFRAVAREVRLAGAGLDMVLDSRVMALADIMDDFGRHSAFERGVQTAAQNFGLVSLMAPWNAAMKQFAGVVTMGRVLKATEALAGGRIAAKEREALAASGISEDLARRIAAEFAEHGDADGALRLANTERWSDRAAAEALRAAILRDVDRIIVTPGQDRPLWMSTETGKLIGQFRSFSLASSQRILIAGLQQRDMAALNGALLSVALGMGVYAIKSAQYGREPSDDWRQWVAEGVDRSGLTGWIFDINNITEKVSRGRVGASALTGQGTISRYASRNVTGALIGPTAGLAEDFVRVTGAAFAGDWNASDSRAMRRLAPYQNVFWMRGSVDRLEKGINEWLGVPEQ